MVEGEAKIVSAAQTLITKKYDLII